MSTLLYLAGAIKNQSQNNEKIINGSDHQKQSIQAVSLGLYRELYGYRTFLGEENQKNSNDPIHMHLAAVVLM
jgi:hypothetical protein